MLLSFLFAIFWRLWGVRALCAVRFEREASLPKPSFVQSLGRLLVPTVLHGALAPQWLPPPPHGTPARRRAGAARRACTCARGPRKHHHASQIFSCAPPASLARQCVQIPHCLLACLPPGRLIHDPRFNSYDCQWTDFAPTRNMHATGVSLRCLLSGPPMEAVKEMIPTRRKV